ncbi:conserved domain protein [delta proteobacterium NaphS2]|nr:conserved domain protein [delta proteobacterium NaphS2]
MTNPFRKCQKEQSVRFDKSILAKTDHLNTQLSAKLRNLSIFRQARTFRQMVEI